MKKTSRLLLAAIYILPCALSILVAVNGRLPVVVLYIASLLISVSVIPGFHGRENSSMFAVVAVSSIPANLSATLHVIQTDLVQEMSHHLVFVSILWGILFYASVFSLEQIIMGVIVRMLWPDQRYDKQQE